MKGATDYDDEGSLKNPVNLAPEESADCGRTRFSTQRLRAVESVSQTLLAHPENPPDIPPEVPIRPPGEPLPGPRPTEPNPEPPRPPGPIPPNTPEPIHPLDPKGRSSTFPAVKKWQLLDSLILPRTKHERSPRVAHFPTDALRHVFLTRDISAQRDL